MRLARSLRSGTKLLCLLWLTFACLNTSAQSQEDETSTAPTTGSIAGKVVNESGQALPHALVFVRATAPPFQSRNTTADNEGYFQVNGLEAMLYSVTASVSAYVSPPRDPDAPPIFYRLGDTVTIELVKGGVITGKVANSFGDPVVQTTVRATLIRDGNGRQPRYAAYQGQKLTDDRGVYRIYGLIPGTYAVSAGGGPSLGFSAVPYQTDVPTYAPSSARDTAAEITVRAGEETTGVDIRYRGEQGRTISGIVSGPIENSPAPISVFLTQLSEGVPLGNIPSFQLPGRKGFAFYGVGDGEYDLTAQSTIGPGDSLVSEPRRITVKGADITGLELIMRPLGLIKGRVLLRKSEAAECKNKRRPLFPETIVMARRNEKALPKDQPNLRIFVLSLGSPNKAGEFQLRNLAPGLYNLNTRFYARYWYLSSIVRDTPATLLPPAGLRSVNRLTDLARNGVNLKFGESLSDVTITLAEGAASLRGSIALGPGESAPPGIHVHLVPAEKEEAENVLRFFANEVSRDGAFTLGNLPPGRYLVVTRIADARESQLDSRIRSPGENELRAQLRRAAEAAKTPVELKPCQNVTDYSLALKSP